MQGGRNYLLVVVVLILFLMTILLINAFEEILRKQQCFISFELGATMNFMLYVILSDKTIIEIYFYKIIFGSQY